MDNQPNLVTRVLAKLSLWANKNISGIVTGVLSFVVVHTFSKYTQLDLIGGFFLANVLIVGLALFAWAGFFRTYVRQHEADIAVFKQAVPYRVTVHPVMPGISAFHVCGERAHLATEEIMIIGPHFDSEVEITSQEHNKYLSDHIDAAILKQASETARTKPFRYSRLLQVSPAVLGSLIKYNGVITEEQVQDVGTIEHLRKVLSLKPGSKAGDFEVTVRAREFIPSFPSILIIDDKHMYFSLLTTDLEREHEALRDRAGPEHGRRSQRSSSNLDFNVVLEIEDDTGETIRKFKKVIRHLSSGQIQIRDIVKDSELAEQPIQRRAT